MEQSKQADQEEYLEEGEEDVGGGGGEEEEGEEGGDASIQNCGPDFPQRLQNPCIPGIGESLNLSFFLSLIKSHSYKTYIMSFKFI